MPQPLADTPAARRLLASAIREWITDWKTRTRIVAENPRDDAFSDLDDYAFDIDHEASDVNALATLERFALLIEYSALALQLQSKHFPRLDAEIVHTWRHVFSEHRDQLRNDIPEPLFHIFESLT